MQLCNSEYIFHICSFRANIGYDKPVMMHEILNGQCPRKPKKRFAFGFHVSYYQTRNSDISAEKASPWLTKKLQVTCCFWKESF